MQWWMVLSVSTSDNSTLQTSTGVPNRIMVHAIQQPVTGEGTIHLLGNKMTTCEPRMVFFQHLLAQAKGHYNCGLASDHSSRGSYSESQKVTSRARYSGRSPVSRYVIISAVLGLCRCSSAKSERGISCRGAHSSRSPRESALGEGSPTQSFAGPEVTAETCTSPSPSPTPGGVK